MRMSYTLKATIYLSKLDEYLKKNSGSGEGVPHEVFEDLEDRDLNSEEFELMLDWILDYVKYRGL